MYKYTWFFSFLNHIFIFQIFNIFLYLIFFFYFRYIYLKKNNKQIIAGERFNNDNPQKAEGRRKKEESRSKKEEGRRQKQEG